MREGANQRMAQLNLPAGGEPECLVGQVRRRQCLQERAGVGAHQGNHAEARCHIGQHAVGIRRDVAFKPVEVAHFGGGGGDHEKAVLAEAGHGQVGLYAAPFVQPLGVDDAARAHIDVVGANPVQHLRRIPTLQAEFGER